MNQQLRAIVIIALICSGIYVVAYFCTKLVLAQVTAALAAGGTTTLGAIALKCAALAAAAMLGIVMLVNKRTAENFQTQLDAACHRARQAMTPA